MTQTADRYGKVLYDLRVPAEDVEQMLGRLSEKGVPVTEVRTDESGFVCGASAGENSQ